MRGVQTVKNHNGMDQSVIDNAVDEWRGLLRECVGANGGHIEQLL